MGVLGLIWVCTNYTGKILIKCQEVNTVRAAEKVDLVSANPDPVTGSEVLPLTDTADIELSEDISTQAIKASEAEPGFMGKLLESYEEIGEAAFGPQGRQFITTVCILTTAV